MIVLELPDTDIQIICDGFLKVSPGPHDGKTGKPLYQNTTDQFKAAILDMVRDVTRRGLKKIDEETIKATLIITELPNSLQ